MNGMKPYRAILIAGPTASGKSALAIRLAQRHRGVVINADSRQVYRELSILTARPGLQDLQAAPHRLYGYVGGGEPYSVGRWLADVQQALAACWQSGDMPIVTGGTGLYFKALLEGLAPIPGVPHEVRVHWRAEAKRLGAVALHALLAARDPHTAARLAPGDTQRLTRALEVLEATGRGLSDWQLQPGTPLVTETEALRLVVSPSREEAHARADARFDAMMAGGALQEAQALAALGYAADAPVMRALGVAPLLEAAQGRMPIETAVCRAKAETRQYIKRQETWFKRNMIAWRWLETKDVESYVLQNFTLMRN